jgi:hypothetical protein
VAICPSCGIEARDGAWTCGACGSPLGQQPAADTYQEPVHDKAYYEAPTAYGTTAPTIQPLRAGRTTKGSKLPWLVVLAILATVAVAGVWFFVLKPAPGKQFLGTWQGTTTAAAGATGGTPFTVTIAKNGALYAVTEVAGGRTVGPFSATLKNGHLESSYDYVGHDARQAAVIAAAKNTLALEFTTYSLIFTVDHGTLAITVRGTPKTPGAVTVSESEKLTKVD